MTNRYSQTMNNFLVSDQDREHYEQLKRDVEIYRLQIIEKDKQIQHLRNKVQVQLKPGEALKIEKDLKINETIELLQEKIDQMTNEMTARELKIKELNKKVDELERQFTDLKSDYELDEDWHKLNDKVKLEERRHKELKRRIFDAQNIIKKVIERHEELVPKIKDMEKLEKDLDERLSFKEHQLNILHPEQESELSKALKKKAGKRELMKKGFRLLPWRKE